MNPRKELKTVIRQVHEQQAAAGHDIHATETARIIERNHPELVDEYAIDLRANGLRKMCADDIRQLQSVTQEPIDGLGLELPTIVTIPDGEGGFAHRSINHTTLGQFTSYVAMKSESVAADIRRLDVDKRADQLMRSAPGANDSMMVSDAVRLLQSEAA